jgi:protein-tyrosine phosphatase
LGNICRSPTAEGVFRGLAAKAGLDVVTDGAGTGAWHIGNPPDRRAQTEAARRGYDLSDLRARQVTTSDFESFDLIVAMDRSNLANLQALRPGGSSAPVQLFLDYAPDQSLREVPDPYYEDNFSEVFDLVETASRGLIAELVRSSPSGKNTKIGQ